ncbi:leucine-rich repeat-containing protein 43-like [Engraulis encrasicolus]|uniref:leucine-rich repeat-containing protein 43-like n=1 Tax=Engraulis encrasicolus TaxID=184585 RepID=UPI002FD1E823
MKPTRPLSTAIENQLRSLCLSDFPCGKGRWWSSGLQESSGGEKPDTEEPSALIDLLTCSQSPWKHEGSLSPQVTALRELSVRMPECLNDHFIYSFLTSLRVVGQRVSVIDEGVLRFSGLEELILCVNGISDIPLKHLPTSLQVLELYANKLSSLRGASGQRLPSLHHLGLGCNPLGSLEDLQYLSSAIWPGLVSLDLSECGFGSLGTMVACLAGLSRLRVLSLEGNPLVLSPAYPGLVIDSLPRLQYLDGAGVTPDDRNAFKGMAALKGLVLGVAVVRVCVGAMRGAPPPPLQNTSAEFPLVNYNYRISYHFLSNQGDSPALASSDQAREHDVTYGSPQNEEMHHGKPAAADNMPDKPNIPLTSTADAKYSLPVLRHSSPAQPWAEEMELSHCDVHRLQDLSGLKSFLLQGLWLSVLEEKVTSWPATETPGAKSVDKKGSAKDKKKKVELVHDPPVCRSLGSAHVQLRDMVAHNQHQLHTLCDYGVIDTASGPQPPQELTKKGKDEKKKEEKKGKQGDAKGKGKGNKEGEPEHPAEEAAGSPVAKGAGSLQPPLTVELSIQLEKWLSTAQAAHTLTHTAAHTTE